MKISTLHSWQSYKFHHYHQLDEERHITIIRSTKIEGSYVALMVELQIHHRHESDEDGGDVVIRSAKEDASIVRMMKIEGYFIML